MNSTAWEQDTPGELQITIVPHKSSEKALILLNTQWTWTRSCMHRNWIAMDLSQQELHRKTHKRWYLHEASQNALQNLLFLWRVITMGMSKVCITMGHDALRWAKHRNKEKQTMAAEAKCDHAVASLCIHIQHVCAGMSEYIQDNAKEAIVWDTKQCHMYLKSIRAQQIAAPILKIRKSVCDEWYIAKSWNG